MQTVHTEEETKKFFYEMGLYGMNKFHEKKIFKQKIFENKFISTKIPGNKFGNWLRKLINFFFKTGFQLFVPGLWFLV